MLNKFLNINKKILIKHNSNKKILLINRERPLPVLISSIIVSAIANKKKIDPIIVTQNLYDDLHNVFKSFGFKDFFIVSSFKDYLFNFRYSLFSFFKTIKAIFLIRRLGFIYFIKNFKDNNILLGDLIYDSYIRYYSKFLNPKIDIRLFRIIFFSIYKVSKLKDLFRLNNIKYLFVTTDCYANNETISARIAFNKKIPVYKMYIGESIFLVPYQKFEIYDGFNPLRKYFNSNTLNKTILSSKGNFSNFYKTRLSGKVNTKYSNVVDIINANKIKKYFSKDLLIEKLFKNKIKFKKIILIAPHAFSDAPHHFGIKFIFRDYYEQFVETLKFVNKMPNKNILWLVRPHPSSRNYNEENIVKNFINGLSDNIQLCDEKFISTENLIKICDNVVTGRGTIGLEFACHGKKPITAGSSTYSNFEIAEECKTKREYFLKLKNIASIKKLNLKQINLAKKILFYLERIYPLNINDNINQLIFNNKNSLINLIKIDRSSSQPILSQKFINKLKITNFSEDELYKFYYKQANNI